jgi:hypothetical protein
MAYFAKNRSEMEAFGYGDVYPIRRVPLLESLKITVKGAFRHLEGKR